MKCRKEKVQDCHTDTPRKRTLKERLTAPFLYFIGFVGTRFFIFLIVHLGVVTKTDLLNRLLTSIFKEASFLSEKDKLSIRVINNTHFLNVLLRKPLRVEIRSHSHPISFEESLEAIVPQPLSMSYEYLSQSQSNP